MKKKVFALLFVVCISVIYLVSCGIIEKNNDDDVVEEEKKGVVRYINFKPEVESKWEEIASYYTKQTGVKVEVITVAQGRYHSELCKQLRLENPPTLFHIANTIELETLKSYCRDLSSTSFYKQFIYKNLAMSNEKGVFAIPLVLEGYGIIYNEDILNEYFRLPESAIESREDIVDFESLSAVVTNMESKKEQLGIDGVFAVTSFGEGEDWRWTTHLFNMPLHYEYLEKSVLDSNEIDFSYNENYKNIFDLYINNSTSDVSELGNKSVKDSMDEFALGKVAMVQNGNWVINQILENENLSISPTALKFLPLYIGVMGEERQGLAVGTENYLAINKEVSFEDQEATINFLEWLITSEDGKRFYVDSLGFLPSFLTFDEDERPKDALTDSMYEYLDENEYYSVPWDFKTIPSQNFKDQLSKSLLEYAQGEREWSSFVDEVINNWKNEKEISNTK